MKFRDALVRGPLVADGAMGTMINASGVGFERSFESLNLTQPELISSIHSAFVCAGADILETNTFAATSLHLDRWGDAKRANDINAAAVRIARSAAAACDRSVFVAGSIGPLGVRLAPTGPLSLADARAAFVEQVSVLTESGVDLLAFETFASLVELEVAIAAARSVCALPILASMSFTREVRTVDDVVPEVALQRLVASGVEVVGANCSTGPRGVFEVLDRFGDHAALAAAELYGAQGDLTSGGFVGFSVMPNAGYPESRGERLFFPAPPVYFEQYATQFLAAGAVIVGGCCGTTPEHISGVRKAVDRFLRQPVEQRIESPARREMRRRPTPPIGTASGTVTGPVTGTGTSGIITTDAPPSGPANATAPAPRIFDAFAARRFVVTVEMEPPKSADTTALERNATMLSSAGATMLNIADTPMARMRMTGLAAAHRVQQTAGVDTVLHFPVRGRNLLRVQGDLLAAHALGLQTLFVTMGDLASIGDYPQAFDHHDIVPTGLVKLVKQQFNVGVDGAGTSIGTPCNFAVGVAANLTPLDIEAEAKLLKRKIDFGADFALTQPVFDPKRANEFLRYFNENYGPLSLPLLLGMLPLATDRHAVFLQNEVPGMFVPDELVTRMRLAGESGRTEGQRILRETLDSLRHVAAGVYFIPAFRKYDVIAELITEL